MSIAKLKELVTLKVNMIEELEISNNWYEGKWVIVGDATFATDFTKMVPSSENREHRTCTMKLPTPRVFSCRVDHERTKKVSFRCISWNPAQIFCGNPDEIRDIAMKHAQAKLEHCARSEDNIRQARQQAEEALGKLYSDVGWKVKIEWN
jgi:hypothetical protein